MKLLKTFGLILFCLLVVSAVIPSKAALAADFNPNKIIDDVVFNSVNSMNAAQIDAFLNSFSQSCISSNSGFKAVLPTGYSYNTGYQYGDYATAGQVIYEAGRAYGLNPQVLIATLEKEQSLVSGRNNFAGYCNNGDEHKYAAAVGYGCPDNLTIHSYSNISLYQRNGVVHSTIDTTCVNTVDKAGFTQQLIRAAWLLKFGQERSLGNTSWAIISGSWNNTDDLSACYGGPMTQGNFARCPKGTPVYYDGMFTIDGVATQMGSGATAALYWYTPHFHGNQNFFNLFTAWFGSTSDSRLFYRVIQGDASGEVYLQTSAGKYYVPSYSLLAEWGFGPTDVKILPQSYVTGLPTKTVLSNTLTDGSGNLYVVEGTNIHKVMSPQYTALWNVDTARIVESLGLSRSLMLKEPLGRFVSQVGGDGSIWLVDGTKKHKVANSSLLYAWGYYPGITNTVSATLFSSFTADTDASIVTKTPGNEYWVVDASTRRGFKEAAVRDAYSTSMPVVTVDSNTLSLLGTAAPVSRFIVDSSNGHWFMVDAGSKYYIPKGELVGLWGKPANEPLTVFSGAFISLIPNSSTLTNVGRSATSGAYWYIASQKYYIPSGAVLRALTASDAAPPAFSDSLLASLPSGPTMSQSVTSASPYNYTYFLDNGTRRYAATSAAQQAWNSPPVSIPAGAIGLIPEASFIQNIVKDETGSTYYVEGSKRFSILPSCVQSWVSNYPTAQVYSGSLAKFTDGGQVCDVISSSGERFVVSGSKKMSLSKYNDTYPASLPNTVSAGGSGLQDGQSASYLVGSTDPSDTRIWLMNLGSLVPLTFEQQVSLGYLSAGVGITRLSPTTLASIPTSSRSFSPLLQKAGSGIKLVSFGAALGFPDGNTLNAYVSPSTGILLISDKVFDSLPLSGYASRVVYGDDGRYWWIENGQKRYITSWSRYQAAGYPAVQARYMYGISLFLLPTGSSI